MVETINKNNIINKIRSKYITIEIFEHLNQNKLLNIIHYNKKYQKLMNKNLTFYKNEYLKIEVEIFPKENTFGKFINIDEKNTKENLQIYFNDNKEEIEYKSIIQDFNVSKIKIIINNKIKSLSKLFYSCVRIKKINFIKFNRYDIKDMSHMFECCSSLEEINLSKFNTNNVTNMLSMFSGCSSLKELNLSNFNTNNVKTMSWMFNNCSSLKELNLSNFNTNNVTYMTGMFYNCSSLKEINLSNFNTKNVTYMSWMFYRCSSLEELNLSNFNTNKVTNLNNMFDGCSSKLSLICNNDLIKKEYENYLFNK